MTSLQQKCALSGRMFDISARSAVFLESRGLPLPTLSPFERLRRRLSFRNQRHLYRRTCSATGKPLISMYAPEYAGCVVSQEYWWSDAWDPLTFGRDFDFSRPFFEQFHELFLAVPQPCVMVSHSENCEYNAYCARSKNCYMSQSVAECENVYYTFGPTHSTDCLDCHNISDHCELCYEVLFGSGCYNVRFSQNVAGCRDSSFLFNCRNCSNCFFCSNLRNANHCFFNEKLSPAAYRERVQMYDRLSHADKESLLDQFAKFQSEQFVPAHWGTNNENVSGNQIFNSKGVDLGFDIHNCEDVSSVLRTYATKSSNDASYVFIGEELHEIISVINATRSSFGFALYEGVFEVEYSATISSSHDLFGCVGMRRKQYCIFNKQYSKDDYLILKEKVIEHMKNTGEWGEFFPTTISPFPYNDTMAYDLCPLEREEILRRGWRLRPAEDSSKVASKPAETLPAYSSETDESICSQTFGCAACGRGFRLQKTELGLLQKLQVPIPHTCYECRYLKRIAHIGSIDFGPETCSGCGGQAVTCCVPDNAGRVFCDACYLQELNRC